MHTTQESLITPGRYETIRYKNHDFPRYYFNRDTLEVMNLDKMTIMNPYYQCGGRSKVVKLINSRGVGIAVPIQHFGREYYDKYINYDPMNVRQELLSNRKKYEQRRNVVPVTPEGYIQFTYKKASFPSHRINPHTMEVINITRRKPKLHWMYKGARRAKFYSIRNSNGSQVFIPVQVLEAACKQYVENKQTDDVLHIKSERCWVNLEDDGNGLMHFTYRGHTFKQRYRFDPTNNQVIYIRTGKVIKIYESETGRKFIVIPDDSGTSRTINFNYFIQASEEK